jgi:membrane carboxypeptidase/penicillin-binding protein PbpC
MDTGLTSSTVYYYKASAYNSSGEGEQSTITSALTYPSIPTNVSATATSSSNATITWNAVTGASGYNIYRSTSTDGEYAKVNTLLVTNSPYNDTGLEESKTYYYKITGVNASGESEYSSVVQVTTKKTSGITAIIIPINDEVSLSSPILQIPKGENRTFEVNGTYTTYQWYLNGSPINGASSSDYTLQTASMTVGLYDLTVVVANNNNKRRSGSYRIRITN